MWTRMATLAAALLAASPARADDNYTASKLYADCTTGDRRYCEGVLLGHYLASSIKVDGNYWYFDCNRTDTTALRLGFVKHAEANPARLHDPVESVILQAWIKGEFCRTEKLPPIKR